MFEKLDAITILCSHFSIYVILERTHPLDINFLILPEKVLPIFPAKSIILVHGIKVTRLQIPMTPGFVVLKYKVQGAIFQTAMLDMHYNSKSRDKILHKKFCSMYI